MMTNAQLLTQELMAYETALGSQLACINEEFLLLQRSWSMLRECYEGSAADQFDTLWHGTAQSFEDCLVQSGALGAVLRERVEALKGFDQLGSI